MYHNIKDILASSSKAVILNSMSKHRPLQKGNARSLKLANGGRDGELRMETEIKVEDLQFLRVDKIGHVYNEFKKLGFVYVEAYTYNTRFQNAEDMADPEEFPDILGLWRDVENDTDILIEVLNGYELGFEFYDTFHNT